MDDDIVTRLRGRAEGFQMIVGINSETFPTLYNEAADEIEQLRNSLKNWRKASDALYLWLNKSYCWHCGVEPAQHHYAQEAKIAYDKAVTFVDEMKEAANGVEP